MRGHYIGALIDVLAELGGDRRQFLLDCGVAESELNSENILDLDRIVRITEKAVVVCPDKPLGLAVGRRLNINTHGPLGYAAMASNTYADALKLLLKYYRVQAPRAVFDVREAGGYFEIEVGPSFSLPEYPWLTTEFLITSIYTSTDFLFCGRLPGVRVWFNYAAPPHRASYTEVFKVEMAFEQRFSGLLIPVQMARKPLPSADPVAAQLFVKRCESMQQLVEHEDLPHRIKHILLSTSPDFPSQSEVAERLHLSVSTLHRKLADTGHSYKELLAEVKKQLAIQHLEFGELTIDEIAHLLGFSDASNFRRAFIGWTGQTPSDFRKNCNDGSNGRPDRA